MAANGNGSNDNGTVIYAAMGQQWRWHIDSSSDDGSNGNGNDTAIAMAQQ